VRSIANCRLPIGAQGIACAWLFSAVCIFLCVTSAFSASRRCSLGWPKHSRNTVKRNVTITGSLSVWDSPGNTAETQRTLRLRRELSLLLLLLAAPAPAFPAPAFPAPCLLLLLPVPALSKIEPETILSKLHNHALDIRRF